MHITGGIIVIYTVICTIVFMYKYRSLNVIKIESTFYGLGDLIFLILSGFEFL